MNTNDAHISKEDVRKALQSLLTPLEGAATDCDPYCCGYYVMGTIESIKEEAAKLGIELASRNCRWHEKYIVADIKH